MRFSLSVLLVLLVLASLVSAERAMPLSGDWRFALDPENEGIEQQWFNKQLPDTINLPASTDQRGKGTLYAQPTIGKLTRKHSYEGAAWYQREVKIPSTWSHSRVILFLERCHWKSSLWVDGQFIGDQDSLSVPHQYDLGGSMTPGVHTLTLRVDNSYLYDIGRWAHSLTDETQTNWNGLIGRIELRETSPVWLDSVQAYPDVERQLVRVTARAVSALTQPAQAEFSVRLGDSNAKQQVSLAPGTTQLEVTLPFPREAKLWEEGSPNLTKLAVALRGEDFGASKEVALGLREFGAEGRHFTLNGHPYYVRGNLECCIFPKTGYPPMQTSDWEALIKANQAWGVNNLRFHSWCPPEAAFEAADRLGCTFQVELPCWLGENVDEATRDFLRREAFRIIDAYGNHPSFCLMSLGNEHGATNRQWLMELVDELRQADPRHLYTCQSHPSDLTRSDDFFETAGTEKGIIRGLGSAGSTTDFDFEQALVDYTRPVITHELAQWESYPPFSQIASYTGHLLPLNFQSYKQSLEANGLAEYADAFVAASGKLQTLLYKEECEAQLRTKELAGFSLLSVQDFPGQGTALVGVVDALWQPKGYVTPEEWRQWCAPTVLLARIEKRQLTTSDSLEAKIEVAHWAAEPLLSAQPYWQLLDANGKQLAAGNLSETDISAGGVTPLGELSISLADMPVPCELTLRVSLAGTDVRNEWRIWVFPDEVRLEAPAGVFVTNQLGEARAALAEGRTVLLNAPEGLRNAIPAQFTPTFWDVLLFASQPRTMGILVDPAHPLFAEFPTQFYADWQWFDVLSNSRALVLEGPATKLKPLVRFIDNYNADYNKPLAGVLEARVGKGKLLLSLLNPTTSTPTGRQFQASLLKYAGSKDFTPAGSLRLQELDDLLAPDPLHDLLRKPASLANAALDVLSAGAVTTFNTRPPGSPRRTSY